ncbi:MAG: hypothetical protein ABI600_07090 [Luteolibacter sp.]
MKSTLSSILVLLSTSLLSLAGVSIDMDAFGKNLGGWTKRGNQSAEYSLSGSGYRTYKPETSPTPDGGLFVSVRIDHVRGWLASDDHAILEVTVNAKGAIAGAQSNIAIQGQSITSDLILGGNEANRQIVGDTERAVQIGVDLVANLSAKMLRENIVEAGRVSFPAALRHNYNLLFQAVRVDGASVTASVPPPPPSPAPPEAPKPAPAVQEKPKDAGPAPLQIKPYCTPSSAELPVK